MKSFKTITVRLSENEHKKLKEFAKKQNLSINNILRKAIELNFNFKTKDIFNASQFLSSHSVLPQGVSDIEKAMLHACIEGLMIMRELGRKESQELVNNARTLAQNKVSQLLEQV